MYTKNLFIVLLCFGLAVRGQVGLDRIPVGAQVFEKEVTELIINADLLLAGEPLQYKTYNFSGSGTPSTLSKVGYVALLNNKDSVLYGHKLKLRHGTAQGSFFIPTTLRTGTYRLLGYTNFSLNNLDDAFAQKNIYIINPYIKAVGDFQKETASSIVIKVSPATLDALDTGGKSAINGILLKTDRLSYKTREKITLVIENLTGKIGFGNYVLSVRKVDPVQISGPPPQNRTNAIHDGNIFYLPELRGELISGKVTAIDGKSKLANIIVALTIPGEDYIFKTVKTNDNGQFFFSIRESYESGDAIVQVDGPDRERYKIVLDKRKLDFEEVGVAAVLQLDPGIKDWLQERSIQLQIENAYFNQKKIITTEEKPSKPFYGELCTEYLLDDYTRFPTWKDTFIEVVTMARIRNKEGSDTFEVFDAHNPYKTGLFSSLDPLLLLDGMMVQAIAVFDYNINEVESIWVYPAPYRYGPKIFRGIIDIKTKKGGFRPRLSGEYMKEFTIERPLPDRQYSSPDYSNKALDRVPDYRVQLYWDPNIELTVKELSKSFYASDVTGTYQIVLEGYSHDGKHITAKQYFKVE